MKNLVINAVRKLLPEIARFYEVKYLVYEKVKPEWDEIVHNDKRLRKDIMEFTDGAFFEFSSFAEWVELVGTAILEADFRRVTKETAFEAGRTALSLMEDELAPMVDAETAEIIFGHLYREFNPLRIYFSELTKISPTVNSTIFKLMEETGELAREVQKTYLIGKESPKDLRVIAPILDELMDVGQTTATLLFLICRENGMGMRSSLEEHINKLTKKGYLHENVHADILMRDGRVSFTLPRLDIQTDVLRTCLKISEEAGELAQIAGKFSAMSGENRTPMESERKAMEMLKALLDVTQCCVTMLYLFADEHKALFPNLLENLLLEHDLKMKEHGYC